MKTQTKSDYLKDLEKANEDCPIPKCRVCNERSRIIEGYKKGVKDTETKILNYLKLKISRYTYVDDEIFESWIKELSGDKIE
jgi:hypothetical protein